MQASPLDEQAALAANDELEKGNRKTTSTITSQQHLSNWDIGYNLSDSMFPRRQHIGLWQRMQNGNSHFFRKVEDKNEQLFLC